MKILCISASNTKLKGPSSASTKVCEIIEERVKENHDVTILPLTNYNIKPCMLCGDCYKEHRCLYDRDFNAIYEKIESSDAIFIVVPHYSPIPSKLLIILEKINEFIYTSYLSKKNTSMKSKRIGIIGHGGMIESENSLKYYHDHLVTPIANTLKSLSFTVVGSDEKYPNGSVFGLKSEKCYVESESSIFPDIVQDYDMIKKRIEPLINNVLQEQL